MNNVYTLSGFFRWGGGGGGGAKAPKFSDIQGGKNDILKGV